MLFRCSIAKKQKSTFMCVFSQMEAHSSDKQLTSSKAPSFIFRTFLESFINELRLVLTENDIKIGHNKFTSE